MSKIWLSNARTAEFEPITYNQIPIGSVATVRESIIDDTKLWVGYWRCGPTTIADFEFPADETFQVFEGHLDVEVHDGEKFELSDGDLISFGPGTMVDLHFRDEVLVLFQISYDKRLVYPG